MPSLLAVTPRTTTPSSSSCRSIPHTSSGPSTRCAIGRFKRRSAEVRRGWSRARRDNVFAREKRYEQSDPSVLVPLVHTIACGGVTSETHRAYGESIRAEHSLELKSRGTKRKEHKGSHRPLRGYLGSLERFKRKSQLAAAVGRPRSVSRATTPWATASPASGFGTGASDLQSIGILLRRAASEGASLCPARNTV